MSGIGEDAAIKPFRYRAFGARIESDTPLPGLVADRGVKAPNISLWLGSKPPWAEHALTLQREPFVQTDLSEWRAVHTLGEGEPEFFHLIYSDGAEFVISDAGDRVYGRCPSEFTLEYTLDIAGTTWQQSIAEIAGTQWEGE